MAKKKNVSLMGSMRFNRLVTGFNTGWVMQVDQAAHQWLWSFPCQKLHQFGGIHLFGAHLMKNIKNVRISHEILACSVQTMDIPHFAHPSGIATESASLFTNPSSKNQPQKGACDSDWDVPP